MLETSRKRFLLYLALAVFLNYRAILFMLVARNKDEAVPNAIGRIGAVLLLIAAVGEAVTWFFKRRSKRLG